MGFLSELFGYLLNALYNVFNNYGIAIIIFSIVLRIILIPITIKQQKSMKKSAELQEEMKEISKKYKNNPEKLNQETIDLYKREKMSPFSGCLSSIVQLLIILAVFWLVSQPLTYMKRLNKVNYDENTDKSVVDYYKDKLKEESMQAMNKNMTYMMPIMSVFIAFIAPLGLALYWFISNILMIIEKIIIDKIINHKEEKQDA